MTEKITTCPSCGATLDNNVGSLCPFCGSALSSTSSNAPGLGSSAPTMISSRPLSKKAEFDSSAEAMDEVKRLIRDGDQVGATEVAGATFGLNQEAAESTVQQAAVDMKHSGAEETVFGQQSVQTPIPVESYRTPAPSFAEPKKPGDSRQRWIIGGVIAGIVFLCCCCCLPVVYFIVSNMNSLQNGF